MKQQLIFSIGKYIVFVFLLNRPPDLPRANQVSIIRLSRLLKVDGCTP